MKNILIIQGHPSKKSFCAALAETYLNSSKNNNSTVELVHLSDLNFDLSLRDGFSSEQKLEMDLLEMQNKIKKADHIVWVYPNWWGGQPALLKGFIDRTLLPGFAFKYKKGISFPEKLLVNKTSELIITMDTPVWLYKYFMGALGIKNMIRNCLGFCGIKNIRVTYFSPIKGTSKENRDGYLNKLAHIVSSHN